MDPAELLETALGVDPQVQGKLLLSAVTILVVWLVRRLLVQVVTRRVEEPRARYQWGKSSAYVAFVIALLLLGQIWLEAIRDMGTFLGLLSAGLAIALKDLVTNVAGWGFILLRHPFGVGDRIQIGDHRGDVVDIRVFQFTLLEIGNWVDADQSTGRVIHVPNAQVFTHPLANYTSEFPFVWHEIGVLVTFESDWKKAKSIMLEIVERETGDFVAEARQRIREAARNLLIFYRTLTPTVYTDVKDSGVLLTMRFICPVRQRRGTGQKLWEEVLEAFAAEPGIDLAYPTQRFYMNVLEGKEGARAELPRGMGGEPASESGSRPEIEPPP